MAGPPVPDTTPEPPLRLGDPADFRRVRQLLQAAGYREGAILAEFGLPALEALGEIDTGGWGAGVRDPTPFQIIVAVFLLLRAVRRDRVAAALPADLLHACCRLDLLREGHEHPEGGDAVPVYFSPVWLYPIGDLWVVSDQGRPEALRADTVYPAITPGSLHLLRLLPTGPLGDALDLGAGAGHVALRLAAQVERVVATDITARAAHFAEFNRRLNGRENVEIVQGDLYAPVADRQFDCIVAHPPYVPATTDAVVFRDAGETGEALLERIVAGAPARLRPGGLLLVLTSGFDADDAPFEARLRRWLGAAGADCDVLFAVCHTTSLEATARTLAESAAGEAADAAERWTAILRRHGLSRRVYGIVAVRRRPGDVVPGAPVTLRRQATERSDAASCLDLFARCDWHARHVAAGDLTATMRRSRPAPAPDLSVEVMYAVHEGSLTQTAVMLLADGPWRLKTPHTAWLLALLQLADGARSLAEIITLGRARGLLPEGVTEGLVIDTLADLYKLGYVSLDGAG